MGPRIRLASCRSFGMMVTRFAWIAHRLQSSNKCTIKSSVASCYEYARKRGAKKGEDKFKRGGRIFYLPPVGFFSGAKRKKGAREQEELTCNAMSASPVHRGGSSARRVPISLMSRAKGNLRINRSVDFWYLRISRRATVPGLSCV